MEIPSWLTILLHMLQLNWTYTQVLDRIIDLDPLFEAETMVLETYQHFIDLQQVQLSRLKQQVARQIREHKTAKLGLEYSSNPLNAFLLIKRLTSISQSSTVSSMQDNYENFKTRLATLRGMEHFPVDEDVKKAANVLLHLQRTYDLDTESISRGELNRVQSSMQLSVDDCYIIGKVSYLMENYDNVISWMKEALRKYDRWPWDTQTLKWEIIEYLAKSAYKLGRFSEAAGLAEELLAIFPQYQGSVKNLAQGMKNIKFVEDDEQESSQILKIIPNQRLGHVSWEVYRRHELLCQNEVENPIEIRSQLKCRYVHKNNPYLLIAPLKEEEAYLRPRILLYRDFIYDAEIEVIRELATPKLEHSKVTGGSISVYRSSKSTNFVYKKHPTLRTLKRRVQAMTSLNGKSFEDFQVTNYGIGGFYVPHYDFFPMGMNKTNGNRIASVLFYMSDVEMGGATVFPRLNVGVWPERGTALFWENLHSSGIPDVYTLHAACPVLLGSKWVATAWVREHDQIFSRPCDPNDTTWIPYN